MKTMKVEILIYVYLAICACMIVFNIVCIFALERRDRRMNRYKKKLSERIRKQLREEEVSAEHRRYLSKKLRRINNLICFDQTLEEMYREDPEKTARYIDSLTPTFIYLNLVYAKRNRLQMAYFPYIIHKYKVCRGKHVAIISDTMLGLVNNPSLYCRENALHALYVQGDCESVTAALKIIDTNDYYFHSRQITDGLQEFAGDREVLDRALWTGLRSFSEKMQLSILNYFRFSSGNHKESFLYLLADKNTPAEIAYCAIRYFGRYPYEPAYPYLTDYAEPAGELFWEYVAIAATALGSYPRPRTIALLKELLKSRNWYVRYNASRSLLALGLEYSAFADIFEGDDRYAAEMLQYRFDQKRMKEKEAAGS